MGVTGPSVGYHSDAYEHRDHEGSVYNGTKDPNAWKEKGKMWCGVVGGVVLFSMVWYGVVWNGWRKMGKGVVWRGRADYKLVCNDNNSMITDANLIITQIITYLPSV